MSDPLLSGGNAPSPPPVPAPRRARVNRTAVWVSAVVLVLHALVAIWALWPGRESDERIAEAGWTRAREEREGLLGDLGKLPTSTPEQLAEAARLLLEVDGFVALQTLAHDAAAKAPRDVRFPLWEAEAAHALRMHTQAVKALTRAREIAPDDVRVPMLLASVHFQAQRHDAALEALAEAWSLAPDSPGVALRYGRVLSSQGRLQEAAAVLDTITVAADLPAARAELAFLRYREGRDAEALALLEWTVLQSPGLAQAHHLLGTVRYRMGDPAGAAQAWKEADRLDPSDPRHLAALCELTGKPPHSGREARAMANLFRRRFPDRAPHIGGACFTPALSSR